MQQACDQNRAILWCRPVNIPADPLITTFLVRDHVAGVVGNHHTSRRCRQAGRSIEHIGGQKIEVKYVPTSRPYTKFRPELDSSGTLQQCHDTSSSNSILLFSAAAECRWLHPRMLTHYSFATTRRLRLQLICKGEHAPPRVLPKGNRHHKACPCTRSVVPESLQTFQT